MYQPAESLTLANARAVLGEGLRAIAAGQAEIDLSRLGTVDSSAVATLLAWKRAAAARNASLALTNAPASLQSLAGLYGVDGLGLTDPIGSHMEAPPPGRAGHEKSFPAEWFLARYGAPELAEEATAGLPAPADVAAARATLDCGPVRELLEATNDVISKAKEDGTYDELYKKWFGSAPKS